MVRTVPVCVSGFFYIYKNNLSLLQSKNCYLKYEIDLNRAEPSPYRTEPDGTYWYGTYRIGM